MKAVRSSLFRRQPSIPCSIRLVQSLANCGSRHFAWFKALRVPKWSLSAKAQVPSSLRGLSYPPPISPTSRRHVCAPEATLRSLSAATIASVSPESRDTAALARWDALRQLLRPSQRLAAPEISSSCCLLFSEELGWAGRRKKLSFLPGVVLLI